MSPTNNDQATGLPNINNLTHKQLVALANLVAARQEQLAKTRAAELLAKFQKMAQEEGLEFRDIATPKKTARRVPAKYRSPDGSKTWSGRGRKPNWFNDALASGRSEESMLIKSA